MFDPIHYLRLAWLVIRHGHLRHSGEDFNKNRGESLKELQEFIPHHLTIRSNTKAQHTITFNLLAQISFIKNSKKTQGGHLSASDINYIRIPKAASTSMSKELLEKLYPTLKQKSISETQVNFLTDIHLQKTISNTPTYYTIVRNPFARLVSVYRDLFENREHHIYRDYLFGILPQQLTFTEFVERISSIPDSLKDQHIKPQHAFLKFYEQKNVQVSVFKLEEPETLNQFLNQYELKLPHVNKSAESYDYQSYYNPDTLAKAFDIYQADVQRFGYETEYKRLADFIKKT